MSRHDEFFNERRAAAVLKHGIIKRYPVVFASKAGSAVKGRKVVFLDGYAGTGRYDDGSPGSPILFVQCAEAVAKFRNVTGCFVEADPEYFKILESVVAELPEPRPKLYPGDLDAHLHKILQVAQDAALFAFLDPFGTALHRQRLTDDLLGRAMWPPTEVLLHFSVSTVARIGGIARKVFREGREATPKEAKTIANIDRFLGGQWWRQYFEAATEAETATAAALRVADAFRQEICQQSGYEAVQMEVRMRPDQLPKYVLVLFTRHLDGAWHFANSLGSAGLEWQQAWREDAAQRAQRKVSEAQPTLFDLDAVEVFDVKAFEAKHAPMWVKQIRENILSLLHAGPIRLDECVVEVYGPLLGSARERHVRKAVKELYQESLIDCNGVGDFQQAVIRRI